MTQKKRMQFEVSIRAPAAVVWSVMLGDETYRKWTAAFSEGSYFEGDWAEGSQMRFLAPQGDGMLAEIAESRPNEFISIRHIGFIHGGVADTESDAVRAWAPAFENYTLTAVPEGTRLIVDQDITEDYEKYMTQAWPRALKILKSLCEIENR